MTAARLKPLSDQTLVITGASSGHGLATARRAAEAGAAVVLVARDEAELIRQRDRIQAQGGRAAYVAADVGDEAAVQAVVDLTIERFGGFDTWVNNAGIGVYGDLLETPIADQRKVFETNYWGVVHGSLAAARHFRTRPGGGAVINVGSINSDLAAPLLGAYNASKHAVKGFTDTLRLEMMAEGAPVSVTLIKPSAIGTPFPDHGRNLTGSKARLPPPIYAPEVVADAILYAAQHPRRAITVGMAGRVQVFGATAFPSLYDRIASKMGGSLLDRSIPVGRKDGNLYAPQGTGGRVEGEQKGRGFSVYTAGKTHPAASTGLLVLGGLALGALVVAKTVRGPGRDGPLHLPSLREAGDLPRRAIEQGRRAIGRHGLRWR